MRSIVLGLLLASVAPALAQQPSTFTQRGIPIAITTATTTQLVAVPPSAVQSVYVTSLLLVSAGANNVQLVAGTGTNCATGQTNVTGVLTLATNSVVAFAAGAGVAMIAPQGAALCIVTSGAVVLGGSLTYGIF